MFDLNFQGQTSRSSDLFGLFEIPDLENVEIDTKIEPVACIQTEITKVT